MSLKVRPEVVTQIDQAAIKMKVSRSEWIRNAIELAINHQQLQGTASCSAIHTGFSK
jgi:metal-responsive CopG/Arc/MetJ family transcriptional regulator